MASISINSISGYNLGQMAYAGQVRKANSLKPKTVPTSESNKVPEIDSFDVVGVSSRTGAKLFDHLVLTMPAHTRIAGDDVDEESIQFVDIKIRVVPETIISKTQLSAQKGTFKVLTGFGDHRIYCEGTFTTMDRTLPISLVNTLEKIRLSEVRLTCESRLLNEGYDINYVIMDSQSSVSQVRGSANTYEFSFELISDFDFDIVIK